MSDAGAKDGAAATEKAGATQRVAAAGARLGIAVAVVEMPAATRTAAEAAAACGCGIEQIVKSLVFAGRDSGKPCLILVSGGNRVDERGVATAIGEPLRRPDADFVRRLTGYAIGGIPPFGHATPLPTYLDRDLLAHDLVWAAAGTPHAVFSLSPRLLAERTGATVIAVA